MKLFGIKMAAAMWLGLSLATGARAQWTVIDLHPAGADTSYANGVQGFQQVGRAAIGGADHASLWNGSAASWLDLQPAAPILPKP